MYEIFSENIKLKFFSKNRNINDDITNYNILRVTHIKKKLKQKNQIIFAFVATTKNQIGTHM